MGNWQDEVLTAAGGRNVVEAREGESSIVLAPERIIEAAPRVTVWITNEADPAALASVPAVRALRDATDRAWHVHQRVAAERNAFDWNETPLVRPDLVLQDLISVLHPQLLPEHERLFLTPDAVGIDGDGGRR